MRSFDVAPGLLLLSPLKLVAAQNVANLISAATLFTGPAAPIVDLGYAKYQGKQDSLTKTSNYLGLKYANAPRFDHSTVYEGGDGADGQVIDASDYGPACPQHEAVSFAAPNDLGLGSVLSLLEGTPLLQSVLKQSEDCLSINVQRPQNESLTDLPVVVWIHGGGFESGASSSAFSELSVIQGSFYQGANLVKRSLDMGQPMVVASINYRLAHFGFTASKEFEDAGLLNLGFEDQRNALHWINKHIAKFGGDPKKVTIMGESAGSISVIQHLLASGGDTEGLYHAAIAMSGGPLKLEGPSRQQPLFDDLSEFVGCGDASDKIECLRKAPYDKIYAHQGTVGFFVGSYHGLSLPWLPRPSPNDNFLPESPDLLTAKGRIAEVPLMMGDMRDEGTLFSLIAALNTTTDAEVKDYFNTEFWPNATDAQLNRLLELYPRSAGAPFEGALLDSVPGPQYGRIAAIQGDYVFEACRRQLYANFQGPIWNYQTEITLPLSVLDNSIVGSLLGSTGLTKTPVLGSFHAFDALFYLFGTIPGVVSHNSLNIMSTVVSFVNHQDPNHHNLNIPNWPRYDLNAKKSYQFRETGPKIITDNYRQAGTDFFNENADTLRV